MSLDTGARTEWRAAWPVPFLGAACYAIASMYFYSAGAFIAPIERDLGWSRAEISSAFIVLSAVGIIANPLMGRLLDRYGARRIALYGMVFHCFALSALSLVESLWMWWCVWGIVAIGGSAGSAMVWAAAIVSRFDKARGLALAITLCGAGLGATVGALVAKDLIEAFGWRGAYLRLGIGMALVALPLIFLLFHDATDLQRRGRAVSRTLPQAASRPGIPYLEVLRSGQFVRLALSTFLLSVPMFAISVNLMPILISLNIEIGLVGSATAAFGVGSLAGRAATGILLDRVNPTRLGAFIFGMPVIGIMILLLFSGYPVMVVIGALIFGLALGGEIDIVAYLTSRYLPIENFGSFFSIVVMLQILALGIGPFAANYAFDLTGSYRGFIILIIPIPAVAGILILTLGRTEQSKTVKLS